MTIPIKDYPKTMCVYERTDRKARYLVTPTILEGMDWVFEPGVQAVDKLHGSNHCVILDSEGHVVAIDNRSNRLVAGMDIDVRHGKLQATAMLGVLNAARKGWFKDIALEGEYTRVYGELIGPKINGNMHQVNMDIFVPFHHLKHTCAWKSWIEGRYPKDFDTISEWFKELPSLFAKKYSKVDVLAEGLVFYHPKDNRVAKLRRDMFEWYKE